LPRGYLSSGLVLWGGPQASASRLPESLKQSTLWLLRCNTRMIRVYRPGARSRGGSTVAVSGRWTGHRGIGAVPRPYPPPSPDSERCAHAAPDPSKRPRTSRRRLRLRPSRCLWAWRRGPGCGRPNCSCCCSGSRRPGSAPFEGQWAGEEESWEGGGGVDRRGARPRPAAARGSTPRATARSARRLAVLTLPPAPPPVATAQGLDRPLTARATWRRRPRRGGRGVLRPPPPAGPPDTLWGAAGRLPSEQGDSEGGDPGCDRFDDPFGDGDPESDRVRTGASNNLAWPWTMAISCTTC
jgi:hypothetical protein